MLSTAPFGCCGNQLLRRLSELLKAQAITLEHEKLTVDSWRIRGEILPGHPCDQTENVIGNPWTPSSAATTSPAFPHRRADVAGKTVPGWTITGLARQPYRQRGSNIQNHQT